MRVIFGLITCLAGVITAICALNYASWTMFFAAVVLLLLGAWLIWEGLRQADDSRSNAIDVADVVIDVIGEVLD
ncbi:hypothetical protein [Massilia sp. CF038]|uniref:hypothetical protein n=1 Tax=Massilia sp. CF038 TaxID=1881045 RepID=UPI0009139FD9|nr:hypothetical protein [Massilia sp. CF038]SHG66900.1 hypothetical protein SAMN05428948_1530 [Massilia sp. CF038]